MSMYKEIKTVTTGATEQAVTFTDEHSYVYAKNIGDTDVYLSALSGIVAGADDVALCAAGDTAQICPVGKTIYVLGASTIEFHATNTDNSPFKSAGKGGGSGDGVHFKGSTTTALTDGATTNPITIDGSSYTAVMGDMVIYGNKEFLFDGTSWHEMGDLSDTVGRKYYVSGVAKGEIFNSYEGAYQNIAPGEYSTAEGKRTYALGEASHAAGMDTQAMGNAQFVVGQYNDSSLAHLFEVGNGTSNNARSNIVEVSSTYLNVNGAIKANGVAIPTAVSLTYTAETEALTLTVS